MRFNNKGKGETRDIANEENLKSCLRPLTILMSDHARFDKCYGEMDADTHKGQWIQSNFFIYLISH